MTIKQMIDLYYDNEGTKMYMYVFHLHNYDNDE